MFVYLYFVITFDNNNFNFSQYSICVLFVYKQLNIRILYTNAQLTIVQFLKSEAATTERSKIVSCFTH